MNKSLWISLVLLFCSSIGYGSSATTENERTTNVSTRQLAADLGVLRRGRILFSHHSVGGNILMGIKRLDAEITGEGRLRLSSLTEAIISTSPTLIDVSGGRNEEPKTKIDFFAATIRSETHLKPDLALMKLCYVDFNPQTDVDELFGYYRKTLEALKREYPEIRFAHVTTPLTIQPKGLKQRIFRFIGRDVREDAANIKRAEFNRRLKESFDPNSVFDLAHVEATAPDGHLTTFEQGGKNYLSLYPGYTEDGGHLNKAGQQIVGGAAIRFMAEQLRGRNFAR